MRSLLCGFLLSSVIVPSILTEEANVENLNGYDEEDKKEARELATSIMHFTLKLYKNIISTTQKKEELRPRNIVFSPLSITSALAMLALGAKSETQLEILNGFSKEANIKEKIHDHFGQLISVLTRERKEVPITIHNAAFVANHLKILKSFEHKVKQHYQADVFNCDFKNPKDALKQINDYVKNKTNNKIDDLVKDLSMKTKIVLLNYIFFKGEWVTPFSPDFTRLSLFSIDNTTAVKVQMMSRSGHYDIFLDNELPCTVLQLPYKEDAFMLLIMPDLGKIEEVEAALSTETIARWRNSTSKRFLRLYMPKFSISYYLNLKDTLSEMGMSNIFSDQADLSGITEDGKLKVSKVIHKTMLDVDERGTEATAFTAVDIIRHSVLQSHKVDRPFLVIICNRETGTILFMGRVVNPAVK
ncbi:hypothetical protein GDO86_015945 [Hymenochirus boettgeri]|uniref:Serpin domain-containing protein n=1 Tax=Hymenochirus boettgeri TaxID=247094 RepID=A0A8T2JZB1_9PIPI|nr:hypothetical protein GDO86_015945 [Hymenochirus boettgeri]